MSDAINAQFGPPSWDRPDLPASLLKRRRPVKRSHADVLGHIAILECELGLCAHPAAHHEALRLSGWTQAQYEATRNVGRPFDERERILRANRLTDPSG